MIDDPRIAGGHLLAGDGLLLHETIIFNIEAVVSEAFEDLFELAVLVQLAQTGEIASAAGLLSLAGAEIVEHEIVLGNDLPGLVLGPAEFFALRPTDQVRGQASLVVGIVIAGLQQRGEGDAATLGDIHQLSQSLDELHELQQFIAVNPSVLLSILVTDREHGVGQRELGEDVRQLLFVQDVFALLVTGDHEQRRLGDIDIAMAYQLGHLAEEEGEQEGADVRAVHISVGHDDDAPVAELGDVKVLADAALQGLDEDADFLEAKHFIQPGLFDVEDLAAKGEDGLGIVVASALGRSSGRITLDDEQLGAIDIVGDAVGEFLRHAAGVQGALAFDQLASFASGFAGLSGEHGLEADLLGLRGMLLQPGPELLGH